MPGRSRMFKDVLVENKLANDLHADEMCMLGFRVCGLEFGKMCILMKSHGSTVQHPLYHKEVLQQPEVLPNTHIPHTTPLC